MKKERNTEQKEYLINYLKKNSNKHLTIQEVQNDLNKKVGLTTIYRMMNSLISKGLVTKISLDNKQGFCYQYNDKNDECINHYHLICEKCNKLYHFESNQVKKINQEAKNKQDFLIDDIKTVFYGICKKCQTK